MVSESTSSSFLIDYLFIAPKIIILGPPASGRHTLAKMLQRKLNAVVIEPEELLREIPHKFKSVLPENPTVVCDE